MSIPPNEAERLLALYAHDILDTLPEREFDEVVELAGHICNTPVSMVSLIDSNRQWLKAAEGIERTEVPRSVSLCAHTILGNDLLIIEDASKDPRFSDNEMVTKDPQVRFYAGAPLRSEDGLGLGALCVVDFEPRKLTAEQKDALAKLGRQVETQLRLRLTLRKLEMAQRQKAELTSFIVHDLKSPLASMLSNARYVLDGKDLDDDERSAIRDIELSAQHMHRLVQDMLDVSRAEDGQLHAHAGEVDVKALIEAIRHETHHRAIEEKRNLDVQVQLDVSKVRADAELLRRVTENLLDNAFKYSRPGTSVSLAVSSPRKGELELRVRDEGAGIPPEMRERIFEKYIQVRPGAAMASKGLGLAFCRLAAEAMGGSIRAEANRPQGSCFVVTVPIS